MSELQIAEPVRQLGKYELLEEIGHGGMATVYRAQDPRLGREVAVKVIHKHLRENKEVAARFTSEARAVAKVRHPNIVEVYDVSAESDLERFLVVELVRGRTLRQILDETGHWPAEVAAALGLEIAAGLDHAHEHGVVHRDVKPENILVQLPTVTKSGSRASQDRTNPSEFAGIKITDFGIAKLLDAQGVTSTGQVLGSPAHMAPEQIEGGEVSARADVFGLGVLLYQCMVGQLPFSGKNPAHVLRRVLEGSFVEPVRARPTIGLRLSAILSKALARDADDRYASCAELAQALSAELERMGFGNPKAELAAFLVDRTAYLESYEPRIVEATLAEAHRARAAKDIPGAAAYFNRALAFRPDDAELLAQVAGLARGVKLKRLLRRGAWIGASVVLLVALVQGLKQRALAAWPWQGQDRAVVRARAPQAPRKPTTQAPKPMAVPETAPAPRPHTPKPRRGRIPPAEEGEELETRPVRIVVRGPQNARVRVDGQERENWFGTLQELTLGPHVFEFIPPDQRCCRGPATETVTIVAGDGPQTVAGRIELKPAVLELVGPPGTRATCGEYGAFDEPGYHTLALSSARVTARCTLIPPPGSGLPPQTKAVTLTAGGSVRFPETASE